MSPSDSLALEIRDRSKAAKGVQVLRVLYHLALADFYERVRRFRFLLTLAAVICVGVLVNDGMLTLYLGPGDHNPLSLSYRGEFNSAWIGMMTALVINCFLGLFGFYLVSDCIKRDIRTGVGQIIATTPVSRALYLIGKWISNCLVLAVLVLILTAAAAIMVLLQGEAALDLGALLMPFLAVALPNMALTAALAVAFETVPWLRGAVGNVAYFFLFAFAFTFIAVIGQAHPALPVPTAHLHLARSHAKSSGSRTRSASASISLPLTRSVKEYPRPCSRSSLAATVCSRSEKLASTTIRCPWCCRT